MPQASLNSNPPKIFSSPEVRVVEASAGSGKTYALAKRYIQLLLIPELELCGIPIRNILAITFTNKAAFEMKARILEFLKRIALGKITKAQEEDLLAPIGLTAESARPRAFALMQDIIHHYNFFQVQTIDKFINALLSGCAFRIGLTANFRIKTNSFDYLQQALDQLLDRAAADPKLQDIFYRFLHNYLYLENRTGWFPKDDMLVIIKNLYSQFNAYGLNFKEAGIRAEDLIKDRTTILKSIKALHQNLPAGTDKRFADAIEKFLSNHTKGFDIDAVSDYFARTEFPAKKDAEVSCDVEKLWSAIHSGLCRLCEEEAVSLFDPYINIFQHVREDFTQLAAKDDVLFLEELNKRAGGLFDDDYVTVEELYYRLAARFRHYLIDEFQDTSRLQWHNLEKMAEEALSTGGTLFYVGDQKQAIYGFRGGDVALFDDIKERFNPFNLKVERLEKNWRSHKAVVEFNNAVFSAENLRKMIALKENHEASKKKSTAVNFSEDDLGRVLHVFSGAHQEHRPELAQGYVKIEYLDEDKKEDRDALAREKVVALVRDLKNRFAYKDIAILARSNQQIEDLTNWLLEEGIPVESERTSNVKEHALIQELVALFKFLSSPVDNLSFVQFVLGDIFSSATGIKREKLQAFVFSLRDRLRAEKDLYVYTEFRREYPKLWDEFLEDFFKNVGLYPLYELTVSIYRRLKCLDNFPAAQGFFMHLLELMKKREDEYADVESFLEYFDQLEGEDLFVRVTGSDAVKILTVHKSKGLEFPVCIIPFLGMDIQIGAQSSDNKQSYVLNRNDSQLELIRLKSKYYQFSDNLYSIYAAEYKKSFLNELNTMYVALTRAQCELYAFIPKKVQQSLNLAKFLIPEELYECGKPQRYDLAKEELEAAEALPVSQYHDWIDYLKDEFLEDSEFLNRRERKRGEALHYILSLIGNLSSEDADTALEKALAQAKMQFPAEEGIEDYGKIVKKLLKEIALNGFFYCGDSQAFTEKEIVNRRGETKRLDRLIVGKTDITIVDFKSSEDKEGRYHEQVREYKELVQALYPKHAVKGFLVYLDSLKVEEV